MLTPSDYSQYPEEIRHQLNTLDGWKKDVIKLQPHILVAKECKEVFNELEIDTDADFCYAIIRIRSITNVKETSPVLKWLATKGYRQTEKRYDSQGGNYVKYQLGQISLFIILKEGASCQFIRTGTREEPIYELQC